MLSMCTVHLHHYTNRFIYLLKYSILIKINEKQTIRNDFEHCHKQRNNNWE